MQWTDEGIVLGVKRHGEASAILELMTREHGRHLGLVRGGFGSRLKPILQPGNTVSATWRARLDEHLGNYTVEGARPARGEFLRRAARDLWRHASRRADAAVARARSARRALRCARRHPRPPRRRKAAARRWWCASNCSCWPNSASASISNAAPRPAARAISSMCRRNRAARCRAAPASLGRQDAAAAGVSARARRKRRRQ